MMGDHDGCCVNTGAGFHFSLTTTALFNYFTGILMTTIFDGGFVLFRIENELGMIGLEVHGRYLIS